MLNDFHTHTFFSDGILSPIELIRYAMVGGYRSLAITDHCGVGSIERLLREVGEDCRLAMEHWDIVALPGVELTHLPPEAIDAVAKRARDLGAAIVVVHGETTQEPVAKGTNLAALRSSYVDILAHPGFISDEEASVAARNDVFLEITTRHGHGLTNDHVAAAARRAGARLILSSDAHSDSDLLTEELASRTLKEAGLNDEEAAIIIGESPRLILERALARRTT
jgi:histidinol phosphatase-like PHP family hydrolase